MHTVNIEVEDWDAFIASAPEEECAQADVVIDGERITGRGAARQGEQLRLGASRAAAFRAISLKIEFDHYDRNTTYHGLDKLSLDAAFQDKQLSQELPSPMTLMTLHGRPRACNRFYAGHGER